MRRRSLSLLPGGFCLALLFGCSAPQETGVIFRDAWSPAAPPGATALAVYGEIVPNADDVLLDIHSPLAAAAELHSTVEENGMMKMRPVERLELKRGTPVQLAPGGMHLMLMAPSESPAKGSRISLTFQFEHAGAVTATAEVR